MDVKELAQLLDGRQIGDEITEQECIMAKDSGLVVVFGYSDDNMELRGAIFDEIGPAIDEDTFFTKDGFPLSKCQCGGGCPYFQENLLTMSAIEAIWSDDTLPCWKYKTTIPHEKFMIYEDGEPYCEGIVFSLDDVK